MHGTSHHASDSWPPSEAGDDCSTDLRLGDSAMPNRVWNLDLLGVRHPCHVGIDFHRLMRHAIHLDLIPGRRYFKNRDISRIEIFQESRYLKNRDFNIRGMSFLKKLWYHLMGLSFLTLTLTMTLTLIGPDGIRTLIFSFCPVFLLVLEASGLTQ